MTAVFVIAHNTFKELIRDRILYGILIFAVLLFFLSLLLGQLSFAEQTRIVSDFGFSAIQISASVLAVFIGGTLVRREIEKKTIFTLLARPVSRTQFLLGKLFGLLSVVVVSVILLAVALAAILSTMEVYPDMYFLVALLGVILESVVLLSMIIFFGSFTSPMLAISCVVGVYLIGHSVESLKFFVTKSESGSFQALGQSLVAISPNLEVFNWKAHFLYQESRAFIDILYSSSYALAWCALFLSVSSLIFNQKDLG